MSQKKGISIFLIAAGLAVFALFCLVKVEEKESDTAYVHFLEQDNSEDEIDKIEEETVSFMEVSKEPEIVCAYICGKVKKSGIYKLSKGSRLFDFIKAAGGFSKYAAKEYLNLAAKVEDEQRIYVPSKKEVKKWEKEKNEISESEKEEQQLVKININTAKKEELMTLTGIGEAKAEAIIYYRKTKGAFQTVEDLMQISGIKEGIYQKICDNITV